MLDRLHNIGLTIVGEYLGKSKPHTYKCSTCGYIWDGPKLSNKVESCEKSGSNGCPECYKTKKSITNSSKIGSYLSTLINNGFELVGTTIPKVNDVVIFKRIECGHTFTSTINNLINVPRVGCIDCDNELNKGTYIEYKRLVDECTKNTYSSYSKILNPNNLPLSRSSGGGYYVDHIISPLYGFKNSIPYSLISHIQNLKLKKWGVIEYLPTPPILLPYLGSDTITQSFINEFKNIGVNYELNCDIFHPFSVTIYCQDHNKAFNLCVFDNYLEQNAQDKFLCKRITKIGKDQGISVIHIFQDEWIENSSMIMNKIQHLLGINKDSVRIHARKCVIRDITTKEVSTFLNDYHIQGNGTSNIKYGAFYNNELVAAMTFGYGSIIRGQKKEEGVFELTRFATNTNYRIPGIASKLLKHFITQHTNLVSIYSYADERWSTGNVYEKLGFIKKEALQQHGYHYIIDGVRYHRWNYRLAAENALQ